MEIVIKGPQGCGKTMLARELAFLIERRFADPKWHAFSYYDIVLDDGGEREVLRRTGRRPPYGKTTPVLIIRTEQE